MTERKSWRIGHTSARFESAGGPGTISTGRGDHGGVSYGTYQLASGPGTIQEYLKWSKFGEHFKDLKPATEAFNNKWREIARDYADFASDQHDFIKRTHVDRVVTKLAKLGLDVESRGPAVQDMVWSTAVQYRGNTARVVQRGIWEAYGDGVLAQSLSDDQIVSAVQDSKIRHVHEDFRSSTLNVRSGVETRAHAEKLALLQLAETGEAVTDEEFNRHWRESSPLRRGVSAQRVHDLQEKLAHLGIFDAKGQVIVADGNFGPATEQAVRAFQMSMKIPPTGEAGALTLSMLEDMHQVRRSLAVHAPGSEIDFGRLNNVLLDYQVLSPPRPPALTDGTELNHESRDALHDPQRTGMQPEKVLAPEALYSRPGVSAPECRLDDPLHPDFGLYRDTRLLIHDLDKAHGRQPDQLSDNLSAALVVAARSNDLTCIEGVELTEDRSTIKAVGTSPGLAVEIPVAEAVRTPLETSSRHWDQLMADRHAMMYIQRNDVYEVSSYPSELPSRDKAVAASLPSSDPRNPDNPNHALFNEIQRQVPQASEDRLLQFTAACHSNRITADNLTSVHLDDERMTLDFKGAGLLTTSASVDLTKPPPTAEEAVGQIQQFDRQENQIMERFQEQQAQMSMGHSR